MCLASSRYKRIYTLMTRRRLCIICWSASLLVNIKYRYIGTFSFACFSKSPYSLMCLSIHTFMLRILYTFRAARVTCSIYRVRYHHHHKYNFISRFSPTIQRSDIWVIVDLTCNVECWLWVSCKMNILRIRYTKLKFTPTTQRIRYVFPFLCTNVPVHGAQSARLKM